MHYLDEGPRDAAPILLIHGEPTWSYLYRKMIPILTAAGHRVIAPDLIGFGRIDKPGSKADYSYQMQVDAMLELVEQLDLTEATFFGQDWGGLVGLQSGCCSTRALCPGRRFPTPVCRRRKASGLYRISAVQTGGVAGRRAHP